MFRITMALLALPAFVVAAAGLVLWAGTPQWDFATALGQHSNQIIPYFFTVYPALLLLGVPTLALARRRGWLSGWHAIVLGGAVGLLTVAWVLVPLLADAGRPWAARLEMLAYLAGPILVSALHGLGLWLLGLWRNRHWMQAALPLNAPA